MAQPPLSLSLSLGAAAGANHAARAHHPRRAGHRAHHLRRADHAAAVALKVFFDFGAVDALRRSELDNFLLWRELKDAGAVALKEIFDFGAVNALMRSELDNFLVA
jgi:hypothetical protein